MLSTRFGLFTVCPPYMASPRWGSVGVKKWGVALFSVHWLWKKGNKKWLVVTLWYNFHLLWFFFCLNYIWNQFRSLKNNTENIYIFTNRRCFISLHCLTLPQIVWPVIFLPCLLCFISFIIVIIILCIFLLFLTMRFWKPEVSSLNLRILSF